MKKRVLVYLVAVLSTLSLQSCVTNYVVSQPTTYAKEYKSDAKVNPTDAKIAEAKKVEADRQKLIDSFLDKKVAEINNAKKMAKNIISEKNSQYNTLINNILTEAETYLGTPYRYGGTTRNGIDCSAFVLSVFGAAAGVNLPRVAAAQAQEGESIQKSELKKGDLLFFSHGRGRIAHVGIVESITEEGQIKFIHSATSRGVMISNLSTDSYWGPRYRFAKRIVNEDTVSNLALAKMN